VNESSDELHAAIERFLELENSGAMPAIDAFARAHPRVESRLRACLRLAAELRPRPMPPAVEGLTRIGAFEVLRELGRGGMGVVYEARQLHPARRVAIKVLPRGSNADESRRTRFLREIEVTAQLRHPAIVPVLEAGEHEGLLYYAMPLLEGASLDREIARWRTTGICAPLADREALVAWLRRFVDVARALDHAHHHRIVHRDIKPSNLFLEDSGRLSVLDFGLTRSLEAGASSLTGDPVGTPRYMSPEQIRGDDVDARTDEFSLAATLYEVLTLESAFPGDDRESVFHAILARDPRPPRQIEPRVPRDVQVILLAALEKERSKRYATLAAFADDLQRFIDYEPIRARPLGPLGRLGRVAGRNKVAAASLAASALLAVALPLRSSLRAAEHERTLVARELELAAAARATLEHLRTRRIALEVRRRELVERIPTWASLAEKAPLLEVDRELESTLRAEEQAFRDALARCLAALRIDSDNAAARAAIAQTAFDELRAAEARRDTSRARSLEPLILAHDDGSLAAQLRGRGRVSIASEPAGARVDLYRFEDKERLRLPIAVRDDGRIDAESLQRADVRGPWRTLVLERVAAACEPLRAGDEVVSICGAPPLDAAVLVEHWRRPHWHRADELHRLEVLRDRRMLTCDLQTNPRADLGGRIVTRDPFAFAPPTEAHRRTTPLVDVELAAGSYVAQVERDGLTVRLPFEIHRDAHLELSVDLARANALGPDFAHVPAGPASIGGDLRALSPFEHQRVDVSEFFVQRREITFAEYFEFVRALEETAPEEARRRAPRQGPPDTPAWNPLWKKDASGRIAPALPTGVDLRWSAVGISFDDAEAYCRWRNSIAASADFVFGLPTEVEWEKAARGVDGRAFPWGDEFEWTFARLGLSSPTSGLLAGGMYPTDVSVYGIHDLCGNVREWCAGPEDVPKRVLRGGAWGILVENDAHAASRANERARDFVDTGSGFRLVARPAR
jgi:formylglycine-generating enzyme required for sulfatase activity